MTKEELRRKSFMTEVKARVLSVALELVEDLNYTRHDAASTLVELAKDLEIEGQIESDLVDEQKPKAG